MALPTANGETHGPYIFRFYLDRVNGGAGHSYAPAYWAAPRYFTGVDRAKEVALKQNLAVMREAVDKFYGDQSRYPHTLEELMERKYIRAIPVDPVTESTKTWIIVPPSDDTPGGLYDLHSGATGTAMDGSNYGDW